MLRLFGYALLAAFVVLQAQAWLKQDARPIFNRQSRIQQRTVPDVCFMPPVEGECSTRNSIYYYDVNTGRCREYSVSPCDTVENANVFYSLIECHSTCETKPESSEENFAENFVCFNDGFHQDIDDCGKYIRCSDGKPHTLACPEGQHYSVVTEQCAAPCEARCDFSLACKCGWESCAYMESIQKEQQYKQSMRPGFDCARDGLYPDALNCSSYIECSNGLPYYMKCPAGLHFSAELERCVQPCDAQCNQTIACQCGWQSCVTTESSYVTFTHSWSVEDDFTCIKDDLYSNPRNCSSYIECSNGMPYIMPCSAGLHFNNKTKRCEAPCEAMCNQTLACKCEWPSCTTTESSYVTFTHSWSVEDDFTCVKDDLYSNPRNCSSYIECSNGIPYIMPCPAGLDFNDKTKRCEAPCEAKCNQTLVCNCEGPYCTIPPTSDEYIRADVVPLRKAEDIVCLTEGLVPDTTNCSRYYNCSNGVAHLKNCTRGLHFNSTTKKCESPCDARCDTSFACQCGWKSCEMMSETVFECESNGMYKNPKGCGSYIQCSEGKPYIMACPSGLHFSEEAQSCQTPCDAKCDHTLACTCQWETCTSDVCQLPVKKGPCKGIIPRWFYDKRSGECSRFEYGGCSGNENNFQSKRECEMRCGDSEGRSICRLKQDSGSCKASIPRYYFDKDEGRCKKFIYGGCEGNENNFETKKRCEQKCLMQEYQSTLDFVCVRNGVYQHPNSCGSYINCTNGLPSIVPCPVGMHFSAKTHKCESPCEAVCDRAIACECNWPSCEKDSMKSRISRPESVPDYCTLRADPGPCRAAVPRFYYDSETGECKQFRYGGCKGNANNFKRRDQCEKTCIPRVSSQFRCPSSYGKFPVPCSCITYYWCEFGTPRIIPCPMGFHFNFEKQTCQLPRAAHCKPDKNCVSVTSPSDEMESQQPLRESSNEADCSSKPEKGSCFGRFPRFYYDEEAKECKRFYWGGCGGNENNYRFKSDCEEKCGEKLESSVSEEMIESAKEADCSSKPEKGSCEGRFPRYYYDEEAKECKRFYWGGCDGNENRYRFKSECEEKCGEKTESEEMVESSNDVDCSSRPSKGPCRRRFTRYYYDTDHKKCKSFIWGGCGGNENRYQSQSECQAKCGVNNV